MTCGRKWFLLQDGFNDRKQTAGTISEWLFG
jgi:hypothetical protein